MNLIKTVKKVLISLNKILNAIGINFYFTFKTLPKVPRYFRDVKEFLTMNRSQSEQWLFYFYPILHEKNSQAALLGEYFWQDFFVAKEIIKLNPQVHVDVGSRIDGFIAHLACLRKVKVFDIRPLDYQIENVEFIQWDITNPNPNYKELADCVTCLHTIEHIGLGRYGDAINPNGWQLGLKSLNALLKVNGILWLSAPVGRQRIEFNAHRIFSPITIVQYAENLNLSLEAMYYINSKGLVSVQDIKKSLAELAKEEYNLGIFQFRKLQI